MKKLLITIDGPAGAGKTTTSRSLADRLGYKYIDTGALYRGIAYQAKQKGTGADDPDEQIELLLNTIEMEFVQVGKDPRLILNTEDISQKIRTPEISMLASALSARSAVRKFLLGMQRKLGTEKCAVFEGRDMGTVVFPAADVKFFLNASAHARAVRRFRELGPGTPQTLDQVEKDIRKRDLNDSSRALAPLKPADDAILIDSTEIPVEGVIEKMIEHISELK